MGFSLQRWRNTIVASAVFLGIAGIFLLFGYSVGADSPAAPLADPTIEITKVFRQGLNGYTGASDATISRSEPGTNFGGESFLRLHCKDYTRLPEQQGALVRFDLSNIPRNARIESATFNLLTYDRNILDDLVVTFHVLSRTWKANQVTWDRPQVGQTWATPGANDGWYDRREKWETYALFSMANPEQAWYDWDVTDAVQYWVEQPQWNHGAKLLAYIGERRRVQYDAYSSEAPNLNQRPQLAVVYTLDDADPTPTDVPPTPTQTPTRIPSEPLQVATFQQGISGYYGVEDTQISRRSPGINFSDSISLHLRWQDIDETVFVDRDEYNPILRFDISSIPTHALVTSASLYLYPFYRSNSSYLDATSHMILRDWSASQATWQQAANGLSWYAEGCGAPTWHYVLRYARGEWDLPNWDYQVRESDWIDMNAINTWYNFDVQEMVQQWIWNPGSNFGLIVKPHVDVNVGYTYYSSEAPDTSKRPKLVVEYWLPPDVPTTTPTATGETTHTPTATRTATATSPATRTPTPTPTHTASSSPTGTATLSPTPTATATSTAAPIETSTSLPTSTASSTLTASATPTETPVPTFTATATATPTALQATFALAGAMDVPLGAPLDIQFPAPVITYTLGFGFQPAIDFGAAWNGEATIVRLLHGPLSPATRYILTLSDGLAVDGREIAPASWYFETVDHWALLPLVIKLP